MSVVRPRRLGVSLTVARWPALTLYERVARVAPLMTLRNVPAAARRRGA